VRLKRWHPAVRLKRWHPAVRLKRWHPAVRLKRWHPAVRLKRWHPAVRLKRRIRPPTFRPRLLSGCRSRRPASSSPFAVKRLRSYGLHPPATGI
jgi:hypothetical protein